MDKIKVSVLRYKFILRKGEDRTDPNTTRAAGYHETLSPNALALSIVYIHLTNTWSCGSGATDTKDGSDCADIGLSLTQERRGPLESESGPEDPPGSPQGARDPVLSVRTKTTLRKVTVLSRVYIPLAG